MVKSVYWKPIRLGDLKTLNKSIWSSPKVQRCKVHCNFEGQINEWWVCVAGIGMCLCARSFSGICHVTSTEWDKAWQVELYCTVMIESYQIPGSFSDQCFELVEIPAKQWHLTCSNVIAGKLSFHKKIAKMQRRN